MRAAIYFRNMDIDTPLHTSNIIKIQVDGTKVSPDKLSLSDASTITFFCQKPTNRSENTVDTVVVRAEDVIAIELR